MKDKLNSSELAIVQTQEKFLEGIGLWASPELKAKYGYRLSPDVFRINEVEKKELETLANLIFSEGGFLDGTTKLFAALQASPRLLGTASGGEMWRGMTAGVLKSDLPIQAQGGSLPFISRVDLMQQESDKPFQIAEIEGDKTHGFGYLSIMDYFRQASGGGEDTPGILHALSEALAQRTDDTNQAIFLIVGDRERFYLPEMEVFSLFAKNKGINLVPMHESELSIDSSGHLSGRGEKTNLVINIPQMTASDVEVVDALHKMYQEGSVTSLIPPNRFLGGKAILGILKNSLGDIGYEALLLNFFDEEKLKKLRNYLPETILITKKNTKAVGEIIKSEPDEWVIKHVMASGTKGVSLGGSEDEKREKFLKQALLTPFNYILQKKVEQKPSTFSYYEPGSMSIATAQMYTRVELYVSKGGIATIGVTATEGKSVHVSHEAIQIPVTFV